MWFLLGVAFMVLGVAFCVLGSLRLPGGRVLRAANARSCGVILLCYFPLVFLVRQLAKDWEEVFCQMLYGGLAFFCILAVLIIILRTTAPRRPVRSYSSPLTAENALFADQPQAPQ